MTPAEPDLPADARAALHLDADDVIDAIEVVELGPGPDEDAVLAEVDAEEAGTELAIEADLDPASGDGAAPVRTSGFEGVGTRREARERALALLYEAESKQLVDPAAILAELPLLPEPFAEEIVRGVAAHLAELDELIGRFSHGWTVVRMPAIDRNLLRMGAWELAHTDVPVGACISEAVELAKRYSTDDSPAFVNGLLGRLAHELRG